MQTADYEAVSQAGSREEFRQALSAFAARMGFPLVNALIVDGNFDAEFRIGSIGNTPSEFLVTHADRARIRSDPVMHRLMGAPTPFIWNQDFYVRAGKGALWEEQAPHGYRVGVAASLSVAAGQRVFVGVDRFDALPTDGEHLSRMQADVQLLAVHAHVAARRFLLKPPTPSMQALQLPHLTDRERDVLRWTHEGKTAEVVAQILGIKVTTVNSYIKQAMEKLDVVGSKHKAAKVAAALGLI